VAFGGDRGFFVYDPSSGEVIVLDAVSSVSNVALVRDGAQLVVGRRDGTFQLWDVDRRQLVGVIHDADANTLGTPSYDEANDSVWLAVPGQAIRIPLDPAVWVERACDVVGRDLTAQEWDEFVPGDVARTPACR
jgi:WD40 repeat protein